MDTTLTRQICPVCDAPLESDTAPCPRCGTDLRLLDHPPDTASVFYNQALDAAQAGRREEAIARIRGAIAADPTDIDSFIVAGKLLAQAENYPEAIAIWQQAQGLKSDGTQAATLQACLDSARQILRRKEEQDRRARQSRQVRSGVALGVLTLLGGGIGYLLHRPPAAPDPVSAVAGALHRPDIKINREGDRLSLQGIVASPGEKEVMIAAAHYAAKRPVDGSGLKVQPPASKAPFQQAQRLLDALSAQPPSGEALHGTRYHVEEGSAARLFVSGKANDSHTAAYLKTLLESVFPGVQADTSRIVLIHTQSVQNGSKTDYTVQPGDTLIGITKRCGHREEEWNMLYKENRTALSDPNSLSVHKSIRLPAGWHLR